jgi:hypothetical protein
MTSWSLSAHRVVHGDFLLLRFPIVDFK